MSGKGKFRIEPFKHRVELDAQVSSLDPPARPTILPTRWAETISNPT